MDAEVIVIGAGAAGLAAARRLAEGSVRVVLLEARARAGGRAYSVPSNRSILPAELGEEFIHGRAPLTNALLREAGLAEVDLGGVAWIFDGDGLRRDDGPDTDRILSSADGLADDVSVERFLTGFDHSDEATRAAARETRSFVEGFEAADPAIASMRSIADEWRSGVDSRTARPLGGYVRVVDHLREACTRAGAELRTETIVREIRWMRGAVDLSVETPRGVERLRAARAIVTLPIGVLRYRGDGAVRFEPPLPAATREALEAIEMGRVVRVVLAFHTAFWEELHDGRYRDASFFRSPSLPFGAYWAQTPVHGELVSAWCGGPRSERFAAASDDEIVETALDGFGTLLGEPARARAAFARGYLQRWNDDPFARGAYSYVRVGGGNARERLGRPVEATLFFAGEATSTDGNGGTVNGALATGERAAAEVLSARQAEKG